MQSFLPIRVLRTFVLCLLLGIGVAACGGGGGDNPPTGNDPGNDNPDNNPGDDGPDDGDSGDDGSGNDEPIPDLAALDLPDTHPRLWFTNSEKLERARDWYTANGMSAPKRPLKPGNGSSGEALAFCFDYLMTGNSEHARIAIDWLMTFTIDRLDDPEVIAYDHARWYMEDAILVYDWCHDEMTPSEIEDRLASFNHALLTLAEKPWGHDIMPANNYFQGYLRNALEWIIASADENPKADELWATYVEHRLEDVLLPYLNYGGGRGGTTLEGGQYGIYMIDYALIPLVSLRGFDDTDGGFDVYARTPFYAENLYYALHSLLPGTTHTRWWDEGQAVVHNRYQFFPFGDDEKFRSENLAFYYADVAQTYANLWPNTAIGRYARHFLERTGAERDTYAQAVDDPANAGEHWTDIPLDYFAAGSGHFFARNAWADDDDADGKGLTVMHFQGGQVQGVGHYHHDAMNLQLWRGNEDGGYFLTRETTAYGDCLVGYDGEIGDGKSTLFHNGVSFEGLGQLFWPGAGGSVVHDNGNPYDRADRPDGLPVVERLVSNNRFAYVAGDYTRSYRAADGENPPRYDDMPYVEQVRRDVVFVRDLEAVVVFDRLDVSDWVDLQSGEDIKDARDIRKTVTWHFGAQPQRDGNVHRATYDWGPGAQDFSVHTLTPAQFNIVDERDFDPDKVSGCDLQLPSVGQHRLEVQPESDADGRSFVITVLHGADSETAAADFSTEIVSESADEFVVELSHETRGRAFLHLPKDASGEGSFAWSDNPAATEADAAFSAALANRREYMYVGDDGPVWTTTGTGTIASDGNTLVGGYNAAGLLVLEQRVAEVNFDSTAYSVPADVTRHRLLRLKPDNYAINVVINGGRFDVTLTRGEGTFVVGDDFALEFTVDENGDVTLLHPLPE